MSFDVIIGRHGSPTVRRVLQWDFLRKGVLPSFPEKGKFNGRSSITQGTSLIFIVGKLISIVGYYSYHDS